MIRFGIAGIPLTSKGRTFIDSVEDAHFLGLNSLEIQLLRVNLEQIPATEYAGMTPKDVESSIVVNILRPDENGNYVSIGGESVIEENDILQELFWNMATNYAEIEEGGELARELDLELSIHAPYYMDLLRESDVAQRSYDHLKWAMFIGRAMGAKHVVTHTGFYNQDRKKSIDAAVKVFSSIVKEMPTSKNYPILGIETSGKKEIFGTVDDIISVLKKVPQAEPIINLAHIHAVTGGSLLEVKDFESVMQKFKKYTKGEYYVEFSGVEYEDHNEVKLTPIKQGDLKFETFSEYLVEDESDYNIISSSPLLEHDAQYMNLILLRSLSRSIQRKETAKKHSKLVETMVREYPVKKGKKMDVETLEKVAKDIFGQARVANGHVITKTPGLAKIDLSSDGKKLFVTTETEKDSKDAENAVKLYNRLIDTLTGYTSKERKKLFSKV